MRNHRPPKDASNQASSGRLRLITTLALAAISFTVGAAVPNVRILIGTTAATFVVVLIQLIFTVIDSTRKS